MRYIPYEEPHVVHARLEPHGVALQGHRLVLRLGQLLALRGLRLALLHEHHGRGHADAQEDGFVAQEGTHVDDYGHCHGARNEQPTRHEHPVVVHHKDHLDELQNGHSGGEAGRQAVRF